MGIVKIENLKELIIEIRGQSVLLDSDVWVSLDNEMVSKAAGIVKVKAAIRFCWLGDLLVEWNVKIKDPCMCMGH